MLSELSSDDCVFPIRALGNVQLCPEFPFLGYLGKHDSFLPLVDGNALDDPHYIDDVDHNDDDAAGNDGDDDDNDGDGDDEAMNILLFNFSHLNK